MDQMFVKLGINVIGVKATCAHCGKDIEYGECEKDFSNIIVANLTEMEGENNFVLDDVRCLDCGCNAFEDVIGFIQVCVE